MFNPITLIAGSAVALAVGFAGGWQVQAWRQGAQQVKVITRTLTVTRNVDHIVTVAGIAAQASQDRIKQHTQALIQEVPDEVPHGSTVDVSLGAGWVRVYHASLDLPEGPGAAEQPADQPVISAADALSGIVANNGVCRQYQDAYRQVVKLYDDVRAQVNGG